jgi:hypothetical protein
MEKLEYDLWWLCKCDGERTGYDSLHEKKKRRRKKKKEPIMNERNETHEK